MKLALLLLFLLKMAASNTLLDEEEGICSNFPSSCPKIQQKKGVCCRRGSSKSLGYHNNFCLACVAVTDE